MQSSSVPASASAPPSPAQPPSAAPAPASAPASSGTPHAAFHPFLRANHALDPAEIDPTLSAGCLPLACGDVIIVHMCQASGWCNGTSMTSGVRGWIPSNYCEPYDLWQIRPLLMAVLQVFSARQSDFVGIVELTATTLISGVRSLLDATNCLTHTSTALFDSSDALRKARRSLLTEVARLIALVKQQQSNAHETDCAEELRGYAQRMLLKSAAYLDIWLAEEHNDDTVPPLFDYFSAETATQLLRTPQFPNVLFDYQPVSASARLNFLYDALLVRLGAFLSRKFVEDRSPADMLIATRQAVHVARELLAVVETVSLHASPVSYSLEESKDIMYQQVTILVSAAREVVTAMSKHDSVLAETQHLISSVAECVRSAGLCLAKSKYVIDRTGDFDLEVDRKYVEYQLRATQADASRRSSSSVSQMDSDTEVMTAASSSPGSSNETNSRTPVQDRILFNTDGQVQGGSLEALVKHLTSGESTPDALFVSTFYLTFRMFTTPVAFAQALVHRFSSLSPDEPNLLASRLRVYNALKGWMESYWRKEFDNEALPIITEFALGSLKSQLPFASTRLLSLSKRVVDSDTPLVPRAMSKLAVNTPLGIFLPDSSSVPTPIVNKLHLAILARYINSDGSMPSPLILEFDPLELARQITIKESRIFCSITPEELLGLEFSKKAGESHAVNVKAMSMLSTDFANLVGESVLAGDVPLKFRMNVIRHWIRVAEKCLELKNYNCLMAITVSLQSTVITRLKKTWELLPARYHALLADFKNIIQYEKNYAVYRTLLRNQSPPCIPYLGVYLTDLTFIDEGNPDMRAFQTGTPDACMVINFDKHVRATKIIADMQRFQVPYRFQEVPEIQGWLSSELARVHELYTQDQHMLYRRSCAVEPSRTPARGLDSGGYGAAGTDGLKGSSLIEEKAR
ncbi:ras guanine nucleotide exchange factor domain-containing protein [Limtongia smithiae]|uniref:ras guanine nucleotide exchange factor domain-containing protein n=1 Tax=Limtongia smithiae TaxID=1125753 RepID=UPI0034CD973F